MTPPDIGSAHKRSVEPPPKQSQATRLIDAARDACGPTLPAKSDAEFSTEQNLARLYLTASSLGYELFDMVQTVGNGLLRVISFGLLEDGHPNVKLEELRAKMISTVRNDASVRKELGLHLGENSLEEWVKQAATSEHPLDCPALHVMATALERSIVLFLPWSISPQVHLPSSTVSDPKTPLVVALNPPTPGFSGHWLGALPASFIAAIPSSLTIVARGMMTDLLADFDRRVQAITDLIEQAQESEREELLMVLERLEIGLIVLANLNAPLMEGGRLVVDPFPPPFAHLTGPKKAESLQPIDLDTFHINNPIVLAPLTEVQKKLMRMSVGAPPDARVIRTVPPRLSPPPPMDPPVLLPMMMEQEAKKREEHAKMKEDLGRWAFQHHRAQAASRALGSAREDSSCDERSEF